MGRSEAELRVEAVGDDWRGSRRSGSLAGWAVRVGGCRSGSLATSRPTRGGPARASPGARSTAPTRRSRLRWSRSAVGSRTTPGPRSARTRSRGNWQSSAPGRRARARSSAFSLAPGSSARGARAPSPRACPTRHRAPSGSVICTRPTSSGRAISTAGCRSWRSTASTSCPTRRGSRSRPTKRRRRSRLL